MTDEDQELCLTELTEMLATVEASFAALRPTTDCECECAPAKRDALECLEQVQLYLQDQVADLEGFPSKSG